MNLQDNNQDLLLAAWTAMDQTYLNVSGTDGSDGTPRDGVPLGWWDSWAVSLNTPPRPCPWGFTGTDDNTNPQNFIVKKVVSSIGGGKFVIYYRQSDSTIMVSAMGTNGNGDMVGWAKNFGDEGLSQWTSETTADSAITAKDAVFGEIANLIQNNSPTQQSNLLFVGDSKGGAEAQFALNDFIKERTAADSTSAYYPFKEINNSNIGLVCHSSPGVSTVLGADLLPPDAFLGIETHFSAAYFSGASGAPGFSISNVAGALNNTPYGFPEVVSLIGGNYVGNAPLYYYPVSVPVNLGATNVIPYLHRESASGYDYFNNNNAGFTSMMQVSKPNTLSTATAQELIKLVCDGTGTPDQTTAEAISRLVFEISGQLALMPVALIVDLFSGKASPGEALAGMLSIGVHAAFGGVLEAISAVSLLAAKVFHFKGSNGAVWETGNFNAINSTTAPATVLAGGTRLYADYVPGGGSCVIDENADGTITTYFAITATQYMQTVSPDGTALCVDGGLSWRVAPDGAISVFVKGNLVSSFSAHSGVTLHFNIKSNTLTLAYSTIPGLTQQFTPTIGNLIVQQSLYYNGHPLIGGDSTSPTGPWIDPSGKFTYTVDDSNNLHLTVLDPTNGPQTVNLGSLPDFNDVSSNGLGYSGNFLRYPPVFSTVDFSSAMQYASDSSMHQYSAYKGYYSSQNKLYVEGSDFYLTGAAPSDLLITNCPHLYVAGDETDSSLAITNPDSLFITITNTKTGASLVLRDWSTNIYAVYFDDGTYWDAARIGYLAGLPGYNAPIDLLPVVLADNPDTNATCPIEVSDYSPQSSKSYQIGNIASKIVVVDSFVTDSARKDSISVLSGIRPQDVYLSKEGSNLLILTPNTGALVLVKGFFDFDSSLRAPTPISFSDGTQWSYNDILSRCTLPSNAPFSVMSLWQGLQFVDTGVPVENNIPGLYADFTYDVMAVNKALAVNRVQTLDVLNAFSALFKKLPGYPDNFGYSAFVDYLKLGVNEFNQRLFQDYNGNWTDIDPNPTSGFLVSASPGDSVLQCLYGDAHLISSNGSGVINGGNGTDYVTITGGTHSINTGTGDLLLDEINSTLSQAVNYIAGSGNLSWLAHGAGMDVLNLDSAFNPSDVTVGLISTTTQSPTGMFPTYQAHATLALPTGKTIDIGDVFGNNQPLSSGVSAINFGNGTTWDPAHLFSQIATHADSSGIAHASSASSVAVTDGSGSVLQGADVAQGLFGYFSGDVIRGGNATDVIEADGGYNILQSGTGNSEIISSFYIANYTGDKPSLVDGGTGNTTILARSGVVLGGVGTDKITLDGSRNVVLFNKGDGADTVTAGGGSVVLSFGGGLQWSNMALSRTGADLILGLSNGDSITLTGWYGGSVAKDSFTTQLFTNSLSGSQESVQGFHFADAVSVFDAAYAANPSINNWSLLNAMQQVSQKSGFAFQGKAFGGDIAEYYALHGSLTGMSGDIAKNVLSAQSFGQTQLLDNLSYIANGSGTKLI